MHRQIGNAVPLPVAHAIGRELRKVLYQRWKVNLDEAIWIDEEEDEEAEHHLRIAEASDSDHMDTD